MVILLCLETATTNCSVALSKDGSVIALREDTSKQYSHAEVLHVFIEEVLAEAKLSSSALDAVAISKGPGSYTGLRIGVSAAKGLCYALGIPLISVPTLQILAHQTSVANYVVPMLDARRMEAYTAVYDTKFVQIRDTKAEIISGQSFDEYLAKGTVCFLGSGAQKFQELCDHQNAIFQTDVLPSAKDMIGMAEEKFENKEFEDVAYFEPFYLKDFVKG
ncbi:MAG: tRNA (adenosine(37)-N6)-threonylcarbamoyltransferase complex dimerization subunit type 1 TsaB [Marinirhabdus sp.]|nr:tRNA (adenosine(37)-N6)-threonylcarbamoyltransferase complex dimerization subunit type 1 TsaB [Marinirhabdus sp.]